jgi:uncharacterized membrane protein HdeD (DUF308 family)
MTIPRMTADTLSDNWWAVALRGLAALIFGVLTLMSPGISLAALVLLFSVFAIADGVLAIIAASRHRHAGEKWLAVALGGIAGIAAGVIAVFMPAITVLVLVYVIAARAIVVGAMEVTAAIRLRKVIRGEWLMALSGVASIVFGLLIALFPGIGALVVVLWIGGFSLVIGALLIALGFRLRSWGRVHPGVPLATA